MLVGLNNSSKHIVKDDPKVKYLYWVDKNAKRVVDKFMERTIFSVQV